LDAKASIAAKLMAEIKRDEESVASKRLTLPLTLNLIITLNNPRDSRPGILLSNLGYSSRILTTPDSTRSEDRGHIEKS